MTCSITIFSPRFFNGAGRRRLHYRLRARIAESVPAGALTAGGNVAAWNVSVDLKIWYHACLNAKSPNSTEMIHVFVNGMQVL